MKKERIRGEMMDNKNSINDNEKNDPPKQPEVILLDMYDFVSYNSRIDSDNTHPEKEDIIRENAQEQDIVRKNIQKEDAIRKNAKKRYAIEENTKTDDIPKENAENAATGDDTEKENSAVKKEHSINRVKQAFGQNPVVTIMTVIIYMSMGFECFHFIHIVRMNEVHIYSYIMMVISLYAVITVILITDNIIMFFQYRKKIFLIYILINLAGALVLSALLLKSRDEKGLILVIVLRSIYLYIRRDTRGKSMKPFFVWQLAFACLFVSALLKVNASMNKIYSYNKAHSKVMLKFENHMNNKNYDTLVEYVVERHMSDYRYEVIEDTKDGFLNVKISGNSKTEITSIVNTDDTINPNTELFFRVSTNDGGYEVTGLNINGTGYDRYAKEVWKSWCIN